MGEAALLHFVERWWPYIIVAAPGAYAVVKQVLDARKAARDADRADQADRTDLIKIAQEAAAGVIQDLRDEADRLQARLAAVEAELLGLRKEHAAMMANKDAKIALLEGEKRQLEMQVRSLEALLGRHGIPAPKQGEVYWEVDHGELRPREQPAQSPDTNL